MTREQPRGGERCNVRGEENQQEIRGGEEKKDIKEEREVEREKGLILQLWKCYLRGNTLEEDD